LTLDAKSRIKNTIVLSREWREIVTKENQSMKTATTKKAPAKKKAAKKK